MQLQRIYTPTQVAEILQLNKATIYELISTGEIVAKKLGKVYRIPASSISFAFTGIDSDIAAMQDEDLKNIALVQSEIKKYRKENAK